MAKTRDQCARRAAPISSALVRTQPPPSRTARTAVVVPGTSRPSLWTMSRFLLAYSCSSSLSLPLARSVTSFAASLLARSSARSRSLPRQWPVL